MIEVFQTLKEVIKVTLGNFTDSDNRLYFLYFISSGMIAYFVYFKNKHQGSFLNYIFNKRTWLSKSAKVDYLMLFFNSIIKVILVV